MRKPRICAVIVNGDVKAIKEIEPLVDLFEVRIDLIGDTWLDLVTHLSKPWIACNRSADEGGQWQGNETRRIEKLLQASELGADIVDIELKTENLAKIIPVVKKRTKCLLSFHDLEKTPSLNNMKEMVRQQLESGADIGKVVTTARSFEDNLTVLQLISGFSRAGLIAFAMGPLGSVSRILCPLVGGDFTYASIEKGKESAQGQLTVGDLARIYKMVEE
jgi:3-dehydroquinate dehydratase type I